MRYLPSLLALLIVPAACTLGASKDDVDVNEQASTAQDLADAKKVLALTGGPNGKCHSCHTATPDDVRRWGTAMQSVDTACFVPANLTDAQRVACLQAAGGQYSSHKLGLYAAFLKETQFSSLFSSPADAAALVSQAYMPRMGNGFAANELALIKDWVLRGMPQLDNASSGGDAGADADADADADAAGGCVGSISNDLTTHIAKMKTDGWAARHADVGTPMQSLTAFTDFPTIGATGVSQTIKKLRDLSFATHYWVRSSADGRWVGVGRDTSSRVLDLSKPEAAKPIEVAADYDPWFLPSNDAFSFAGVHTDQKIHVCQQSLLTDVSTQPSPSISLTEAKCAAIADDVYESIGSALDSVRYFVAFGTHENDDGANDVTRPQPAAFGASATATFVPMVNDGTAYKAEPSVDITMPNEGDIMLSPSTLAAVTRTKSGYRIHMVNATRNGATTTVTAPLAGSICLSGGGKASFSFDERFIAVHQYAATGPVGSNIVIADLKTGNKAVVTNMPASQFALYPHFRADGWLYFLVRDKSTGKEYFAATDAAIQMAAASP
jgi:hypothetical protein